MSYSGFLPPVGWCVLPYVVPCYCEIWQCVDPNVENPPELIELAPPILDDTRPARFTDPGTNKARSVHSSLAAFKNECASSWPFARTISHDNRNSLDLGIHTSRLSSAL